MPRPAFEVADIFRSHGAAWRQAHAGHLSPGQLKAMAAIEACRTAELGGHVARCEDCGHTVISYNSCGNRHCPWFGKLTMRVPGCRSPPMARGTRGRASAAALLSCGVHAAPGDWRHRLAE